MDMEKFGCRIPAEAAGQRLDRFLGERIPHVSREKIKRAIQEGQCRVQGLTVTTPSTRILPGQDVELTLPPTTAAVCPEAGDIAPLWQDEHLLVLDKPAHLTVHPCPSCPEGTLVQRLATHFPQLLKQEGQRPGIVHRLDKDTSGLLAVALTENARLRLADDFAARRVDKEYLALVRGVPAPDGETDAPLGRHPLVKIKMAVVPENRGGRAAYSRWRVLYADPAQRFALLAVRILTGRTHQIRVHMAHAGFPLWGDALYGPGPQIPDPAPRQMLHAWQLTLPHPVTGERLSFSCPPPPDMLETALTLSRRLQRVVITGLPGCGKSSLLRLWEEEGVPTWSADAVVTQLYAPGGHGHDFLRTRFGNRFVPARTACVDRTALREAMQEDPFLRQEVESAIHALVWQELDIFWQKTEDAGQRLAAAEIPLYLEKGWHQENAENITLRPWLVGVFCPDDSRHARLEHTRHWTAEQCRLLDRWQWPQERKMHACDWQIDNSGDQQCLDRLARKLLQTLWATLEKERDTLSAKLAEAWRI